MKVCWDCKKTGEGLVKIYSSLGESYCCENCLEKLLENGTIKPTQVEVLVRQVEE